MLFLEQIKRFFFLLCISNFSEVAGGGGDDEAQKTDQNNDVQKDGESTEQQGIQEKQEEPLTPEQEGLLDKLETVRVELLYKRKYEKVLTKNLESDVPNEEEKRSMELKDLEEKSDNLEKQLLELGVKQELLKKELGEAKELAKDRYKKELFTQLESVRVDIIFKQKYGVIEKVDSEVGVKDDTKGRELLILQEKADGLENKLRELGVGGIVLEKELLEAQTLADLKYIEYKNSNENQDQQREIDRRQKEIEDSGFFERKEKKGEFKTYMAELNEYKKEKNEIANKMKDKSFDQFLAMDQSERLKMVTRQHVEEDSIIEGKVKSFDINFAFNGKYNREIYDKTTAGTILSPQIREIEIGGTLYKRRLGAEKGEFFSKSGKRGLIHDSTEVAVISVVSKSFLKKMTDHADNKMKGLGYENGTREYAIAKEALDRGIHIEFAVVLLSGIGNVVKKEEEEFKINEDLFIEIDRQFGFFQREFPESAKVFNLSGQNVSAIEKIKVGDKVEEKYSIEFISYITGAMNPTTFAKCAKVFGYSQDQINVGKRFQENETGLNYKGSLDSKDIANKCSWISVEDINRLRNMKSFPPYSNAAKTLFKVAAQYASQLDPTYGVEGNWSNDGSEIYKILGKESGGQVGRLNYTIKGMSTSEYKKIALSNSNSKNPLGTRSTASGLGQLLLRNIDKYYPSGRSGIGDPIEEAIGYLRYVGDRYGNPKTADDMYGETGPYRVGGVKKYKSFEEGY